MPNDYLFKDHVPSSDQRFYGPGYVCGYLQITPGQLVVLMEAAGVEFSLCLDDVPFLNGEGFLAVVAKCKAVRAEIEAAGKKMEKAPLN